MFKGFKAFLLRGNVIDLAVAVVVGTAFTALVTSIVTNIINPVVSIFFTASSLNDAWILTVNGSHIKLGAVLGSVITFVIIAAIVYFVFVYPINALQQRMARSNSETAGEKPPTELELLTEIRDLLQNQSGPRESNRQEPPLP